MNVTELRIEWCWGAVYYTKMYAKRDRVAQLNTARVNKPCVENCAHPGYYAANSGNFLPTFRDNQSVPKRP